MEMPLYRKTMVFKWHKLSKRAEKTLKTTLVLEEQSREQMIKMWVVQAVMAEDRRLSVRMTAEETGLKKCGS
jgi:hypothetical protein